MFVAPFRHFVYISISCIYILVFKGFSLKERTSFTVRQFNIVCSLRHLSIEHRTADCKYKLVNWDHRVTFTFVRRHWNNKFHINQELIVENKRGSFRDS